jgi:hypothetical protein
MNETNTPHNPQATLFSQFVPGFDFLQNLASAAAKGSGPSMPGMPSLPKMGAWVAPTLSVEELDKRIEELKTVQFWLDQNAHALKATIQALEVQKMTLATLESMNVKLGDVMNAFTPKAPVFASTPAPADEAKAPEAPAFDPMQLWTSLSKQFQEIAAVAVKDVVTKAATQTTTQTTTQTATQATTKTASKPTTKPAVKSSAKAAVKRTLKPAA